MKYGFILCGKRFGALQDDGFNPRVGVVAGAKMMSEVEFGQ